jgi:hypothetical protein
MLLEDNSAGAGTGAPEQLERQLLVHLRNSRARDLGITADHTGAS